MFEEILARPAVNFPISVIGYLAVFTEALVLGLIVSAIYKKKNLSHDRTFQYSLWLVAPIVATLLLFIGSNLALSIGMIGSLSIIRFRTAIKDPLDLMYLFILIMIGLGCGTQNFLITALATALMSIILLILGSQKRVLVEECVLILKDTDSSLIEKAIKEIKSSHPKSNISQLSLNANDAQATINFQSLDENWILDFKNKHPLKTIHFINK